MTVLITNAFGKRADLLVIEGDPTIDVAALSRIRLLVADGVIARRPVPEPA